MALQRKPRDRQYDSLSEDVLRSAVEKFGVGELLAARTLVIEGDRVVILNQKTETSRKYVIDAGTGRYFLKEVPWYCDDEAHRTFSRRMMNHLAADLPVPRVLPTRGGDWDVPVDGSTFVLLEYRSGSPYDRSPARWAAAARALAMMHRSSGPMRVDDDAPREDLAGIVSQHIDLAAEVRPPRTQQGVSALAALRDLAAGETGQVPTATSLVPVHGDFIPWNLAFGPDGTVTAIHDFDNSCIDSRLHDIGEALSSFFLVPHAGESAILRPISDDPQVPVEAMRGFLRHYHRGAPLAEADRSALRSYVLGAWWESILLSYIRGDQPEESLAIMTRYPSALAAAWERLTAPAEGGDGP